MSSLFSLLPVSNLTSIVQTRVTELGNDAYARLGTALGSIKKLAQNAPPITTVASREAFSDARFDSQNQLDDQLRALAPVDYGRNDTVSAANQQAVEDAVNADVSAVQQKAVVQRASQAVDYKVKLVEKGVAEVIFDIMPSVTENRQVEYEAVQPSQYPTAFQKYKGTAPVQWSINATLVSRTSEEATANLRIINTLRGWTMPFFGVNTAVVFPDKLGAPPPVLWFSGWTKQMVGPVPTVITAFNWDFPQDVDYIPAYETQRNTDSGGGVETVSGSLIPFPAVLKVAIQLVESYSTDMVNGFSLADFRLGQFERAWQPLQTSGATNGSPATFNDRRNGGFTPPEEAQPGVGGGRDLASGAGAADFNGDYENRRVSELTRAGLSSEEGLIQSGQLDTTRPGSF